jgi:hypothetical protein
MQSPPIKNTHAHPQTVQPIANERGGAMVLIVVLSLMLALIGAGGYYAYSRYMKPAPLRDKLSSAKMKSEVIHFVHDDVSPSLYRNMILLDDIMVIMDKELKRLERIGKKFPNQRKIVAAQSESLNLARERMAAALDNATAKLEKMYVTWLVDRARGVEQIKSQRAPLTQLLVDAIRHDNALIGSIRANPNAAT